jgi:hypothetical protein
MFRKDTSHSVTCAGLGACVLWEGSTTVVYTVVRRSSVVWLSRGNTVLWLVERRVFWVCAQFTFSGYGLLFSQSQRRISPGSSNHGISPNGSVNYSGWPLPVWILLPEPSPCLFERLRIWPFHTVRSVGKAGVGFQRSDILPAGTPKRRLSECNLG